MDESLTLHPADAEERLGFDVIRKRLLGSARTPYGAERLAALQPSAEVATVQRRLDRTSEMQALLVSSERPPLPAAADLRPLLRRVAPQDSRAEAEELADAGKALEGLRRLHAYLQSRQAEAPELWRIGSRIVPLKGLEDRITQTVTPDGEVRDDASPELLRLTRAIRQKEGQLRSTLMRALRNAVSEGWATEEQPTIRGGRAVIPVRAEAKRKVQGFVHDVSASGQTVYIEPTSVLDLNNDIRELQTARRHEIDRVLRQVTAHLRTHREDLAGSLEALGLLDGIAAMGRLAGNLDGIAPEVGEGGAMRLVKARNPVLMLHVRREAERRRAAGESDVERREVVPLQLDLGEENRTLVITGPNAGGKSVAMKTIGLMALMTACGLPVPAAPGTRVPVLRRLFVDLGDQQSIEDDLSTFTSHLTNLRMMLSEADGDSLVLIDEAGTGTDPAEGGALAEAVLRRLTDRGALTVATTHHGTLKAFAHDTEGVVNGSMMFDRETLAPTYRFQMGVPGSSYAFEIAGRVGLDEAVVEEARRLVGEGASRLEDLIAAFEEETQAARIDRKEAERLSAESERLRADYEQRLETLRAERDELKAEALARADQILKNANAAVERTIREIKEAEAEKEATRKARKQLEETKKAVREKTKITKQRQKKRKAASRGKPDPASANGAASGPIEVGDRVRVEGANAVGEVLEMDDAEAQVALGALTTRVTLDRLTKVGGTTKQRVSVSRSGGPASARSSNRGTMPATRARMRIDLRGERVEAARMQAERFVDEAISSGLPRVEILHGKGTGALREAIHADLRQRGDIEAFEVAPWNQGGDGVTVVLIG